MKLDILKQGLGYGLVGFLQLALEWLLFIIMMVVGVPVAGANILTRVVIAGIGFWLNGKWTFRRNDPPALGIKHFGRYLTIWLSTTLLSTLAVMLAARNGGVHVAWIIKPVAK